MIEAALPAARSVHFAATLLIEGWVVFHVLVAEARATFAKAIAAAWILAVVSGIAWWLLLAASIGDARIADAVADGTAWTLLTQTQFGWIWLARAAGFVLFAILLGSQPETPLISVLGSSLRLARAQAPAGIQPGLSTGHVSAGSPLEFIPAKAGTGRAGEGWRTAVLIALSIALAGSLAWTGHAAATPGAAGTLLLAADILHLIASGIWLGGLLPFAIALACDPDAAAAIARRFSSLATACVLALVATGIVNAWMIVGGIDALTGTLYGRLLLAKLALFLLMLAFAGVNRFVLTPQLAIANLSARARQRLVIHSGCEIALGLAILAIVGLLGTLTPMQEHRHSASARAAYSPALGGGSMAAGPRSGRSSIAIKNPMPQSATKAQAAKT